MRVVFAALVVGGGAYKISSIPNLLLKGANKNDLHDKNVRTLLVKITLLHIWFSKEKYVSQVLSSSTYHFVAYNVLFLICQGILRVL